MSSKNQNFGANATTYIVPAVVFPSQQKGTCHGISAAAGKLGAILGALSFVYLQVLNPRPLNPSPPQQCLSVLGASSNV